MENGPTTKPTHEAPVSRPEKSDDKDGKNSKEKLSVKKQKAEQDIAHSLDKLSLFASRNEFKTKAEKLETKPPFAKDELAKPLEASEADAPTKELSQSEDSRLKQEIASEHLTDLPEVDRAAELEPVAEFLTKIVDGESVEAAFSEAAGELGMSETEIAEALTDSEEPAELEAAEELASDDENQAEDGVIDPSQTGEGEIGLGRLETAAETDVTPASANGGSAGSGNGQSHTNSSGSNVPPPTPPTPANVYNPNLVPASTAYYYERRNRHNGLLIGGLVGYLVGRRRGRLKTEKRLLPVQKRLEYQVRALERDISFREQLLIRKGAERRHAGLPPRSAAAETVLNRRIAAQERTQPGRQETRLGLEKPQRAERLGHMVVSRQSSERQRDERPNNIRQAFRPEQVKTMHRRELLELSEKILVEGASLRHIYESHLIGEKQLRHLVSEYLDGKDIRRQLRKEMIEREIDFERDPILRDRVRSRLMDSTTSLNQLLEKAGALPQADDRYEHQASKQAEKAAAKRVKQQRQRRLADGAMITVIVVLAVLVTLLLLSR